MNKLLKNISDNLFTEEQNGFLKKKRKYLISEHILLLEFMKSMWQG
jgi:hypothetical protein